MRIEHVEPQNEFETTIRIEGLARPVTFAHVTDSHLAECDERDARAAHAASVAHEHFSNHSPTRARMREVFRDVLGRCLAHKPDYLVLTGDMVHLPTWASIDALTEELARAGVPYLYTSGNHDWHYPGREWNEQTRLEYYPRLARLTCGMSPSCQVREIGGVLLVAIDNSNYQASEEQVAFLRQQLATGKPCLLFMHIPVYIPSLCPAVIKRWTAPIMMGSKEGWTAPMRKQFQVREDDPGTRAFCDLVADPEAGNLAGLFCGHIHIPHADEFRPGMWQYMPRAGYLGGSRVVRLVP